MEDRPDTTSETPSSPLVIPYQRAHVGPRARVSKLAVWGFVASLALCPCVSVPLANGVLDVFMPHTRIDFVVPTLLIGCPLITLILNLVAAGRVLKYEPWLTGDGYAWIGVVISCASLGFCGWLGLASLR